MEIADKSHIKALGSKVINVEMQVHGKWTANHLENVWYVPNIGANLFSESVSLFNTSGTLICMKIGVERMGKLF